MKNISILGSTGSIGVNALDVISKRRDQFRIVALAAGRNIDLLEKQIDMFAPRLVSVIDEDHAKALERRFRPGSKVKVVFGDDGYRSVAADGEVDMVLSAMVGAAGLLPTLAAIEAGKDIALANKETLVMAGRLVMEKAKAHGVRILPVDSEHSAVFQCLEGHRREAVKRIILTASGGPFLHVPLEEMPNMKPAQALKHPNWSMGEKITIDSASMMNKGLEIIEARWLFDVPFDKIDVVIHPQSIVHSLVEFADGSLLAQLGQPDMRIPIAYALTYPERMREAGPSLNLTTLKALTFDEPDERRFPCLALARKAGERGASMPAVLNAANEIAVENYLSEKILFTDIPRVVEGVMNQTPPAMNEPSIRDLLDADREARKKTREMIEGMTAWLVQTS